MYPRLTLDIAWRDLLWAAFGGDRPQALPDGLVAALSARTLFDTILNEAALPPGSPVVMSGINIQNMADLIRLHGLAPHFVDVAPDTLLPENEVLLDAQARTGAKLCLVAHLFGGHSPIKAIDTLRARGVCVIEDLAQGFSPEALAAEPAGDIALFSFGPIKRRTALGGALGRFRDAGLAGRIRGRLNAHPPLGDGWFRVRARKYLLLKALNHPLPYGLLFRGLESLGRDPDTVIGRLARGFSGDDLRRNIRHRPSPRLLQLMARQVAGDHDLPRRQALCTAFLARLPVAARIGQATEHSVHWLLPVIAPDPDGLILSLRRQGFDATRGATSLRAFTGAQADRLIDHIVYLPHPADMAASARDRLAEAVIQALARAG